MTVEETWQKYLETRSSELREELILEHLHLVKHIAGRLAVRLPAFVAQEDLEGWGVFGLIEAVEKYDPSHGTDFQGYAYYRIRGAMLDEIRKLAWVPRSLWQKLQQINAVRETIEHDSGLPATNEQVADTLGLSLSEYHQLMAHFQSTSPISLDEPFTAGDGDHVSWTDFLEDESSPDPLNSLLDKEYKETLVEAINLLGERDKLILALYYQDGLTLKEIGLVLNVSESRVCQLHTKAINRLRKIIVELEKKGNRDAK
ncbi:sigma-70 family RNA polymerase sigma factor [Desulforudis sp. 1088]|uniref:sigma-70 family RNA polymerase sigma factor n=1 Tax=unclassified Candidatus Desulforudis TaxID=2635950 RepID=UPI003CE54520